MKNGDILVYLNGLRMNGKREPPEKETNTIIRAMVIDLFKMNGSRKHKCSKECNEIWTIAIGPNFTEKKTFMECVPRYYRF